MARTFDLVCHDCRLALWIGQRFSGADRPYLYGTGLQRAAQEAFLFGHIGHRLEVNDSEQTDSDYTALDAEGTPFADEISDA
jgi:hypothetical protein